MSSRSRAPRASQQILRTLGAAAFVVSAVSVSFAGRGLFRNNAVGGVSIDTAGVLREPNIKDREMLLADLRKEIATPVRELNRPVNLRMISLRGLHAAIEDALANNLDMLPDEVQFLGGLQRIEWVVVDQANNDILLGGPAEGWIVDDNAVVVGVTTGRPVMRLDDLLVALRTVKPARDVGISVSIDPTQEGYRNLSALVKELKKDVRVRQNPRIAEPNIKRAFGPQQIKIAGVPRNSHFARVMTAADYRMKRYAMALEMAPIKGLPSYLDLIKSTRGSATNMNPRWWLTTDYEPLARSEDGMAWKIRGRGVKCMTETDVVNAEGNVRGTGRKNPRAQKWADLFTQKYDALSQRDAAFGELRNLMDMCVVAALIEQNELFEKAGLSLPRMTDPKSDLDLEAWNTPKTVDPQCSFVRVRGGRWVLTASGGVEIESWDVVDHSEVVQGVGQLRNHAMRKENAASWFWNVQLPRSG